MEILYLVARPDFPEVEQSLLKDDVVSRQSLVFRTAGNYIAKEDGILIKISGSDEGVERAKGLVGGKGKTIEGKDKERILKQIAEEEDSVAQGFGSIFE